MHFRTIICLAGVFFVNVSVNPTLTFICQRMPNEICQRICQMCAERSIHISMIRVRPKFVQGKG